MMSVTTPGQGYVTDTDGLRSVDDDRGYGWVLFAATMLGLAGILNFMEGVAAVANSHVFVGNARYVIGDLHTWGWTVLIIGVIQGIAGLGILAKSQVARWVGVLVAMLNAIAQLLLVPAYPVWSLVLFTVDVLVIYGLVAYGGRSTASN
jgi:hypothetical protein